MIVCTIFRIIYFPGLYGNMFTSLQKVGRWYVFVFSDDLFVSMYLAGTQNFSRNPQSNVFLCGWNRGRVSLGGGLVVTAFHFKICLFYSLSLATHFWVQCKLDLSESQNKLKTEIQNSYINSTEACKEQSKSIINWI